jgi:hypothetical protein
VLDLSRVGFVDGRGIATIASRADRVAAAGRTLLITGASPMVRRLWELCGFEATGNALRQSRPGSATAGHRVRRPGFRHSRLCGRRGSSKRPSTSLL